MKLVEEKETMEQLLDRGEKSLRSDHRVEHLDDAPRRLSDEEIVERARQACDLRIEVAVKKLELKDKTKELKSGIAEIESYAAALDRQVSSGIEHVPGDCLVAYRWQDGEKDLLDADGVVLETRRITDSDRQGRLL